ncbi:hypothetical protein C2857_000201 [Epichloe festucae Fl1]|uniref:Uncharacterized protein n=1 Tax=Epichloe festucae (strain Fl1) TaxID=877507 RepID=A0A7S9KV66_EPIFF|nr:hypothetical protein C2857_000201 [Epichloe festucae Fl1]
MFIHNDAMHAQGRQTTRPFSAEPVMRAFPQSKASYRRRNFKIRTNKYVVTSVFPHGPKSDKCRYHDTSNARKGLEPYKFPSLIHDY